MKAVTTKSSNSLIIRKNLSANSPRSSKHISTDTQKTKETYMDASPRSSLILSIFAGFGPNAPVSR